MIREHYGLDMDGLTPADSPEAADDAKASEK